jgi:hypothetical protein
MCRDSFFGFFFRVIEPTPRVVLNHPPGMADGGVADDPERLGCDGGAETKTERKEAQKKQRELEKQLPK